LPDDSTFCSSCGRPLKAEGIDIILPPDGSSTDERATIYLMLAIMALFFGFFLLIPGYFVGLGFILPALGLIVVGFAFLYARYHILRRYARRVEQFRKDAAIRVRCRYCGTLNPDSARRCESCGATL
jgi:Zn-dependent protease with chaperone function